MSDRSYTCAQCGKKFELPFLSSLSAKAEAQTKFPTVAEREMVVVCDDCYKKLEPNIIRLRSGGVVKKRKHWWSKK